MSPITSKLTVLIATGNPAKAQQLQGLFSGLPVSFTHPAQVAGPPTVVEDASAHLANAQEKAVAWSRAAGGLALASDGGLVVPALGETWNSLTTRRSMGDGLDDRERAGRMLAMMKPYHGTERRVSFVEALAVARDGEPLDAWQAEGLHGLLDDTYEPAPETPEGFWVAGLWLSLVHSKRYWRLTEAELAAAEAPWLQLRPHLHLLIEKLALEAQPS